MKENTHRLVVLSGASRGMGQAMARQLLAQGCELLTISRSRSAALDEAAQQGCGSLLQWQLDLAQPAQAARQLHDWLARRGACASREAVLINNAGVIPEIAPFSRLAPGNIAQALAVGLQAPMLLAQAFLAATEGWSGVRRKLLNISSGLGRRPMASQACYCTAKAGLDQFSLCVALEEARKPHGAKVCSLAPGVIDTDMQRHLRGAATQDFPDLARFEQLRQQRRLSSPEQAAAQVLAWLEREDFGERVIADVRQP